ncbi:hypothetical protein HMPREF1583_00282 [Gardnerella vaginalis JCP8151B]|nr:hypothetical protein HMPREF1582_00688 [Gardnerella vaginalis JCP8151A]EPI47858.1 hypothetical protein HMPREF1583_00282 [Gardnerella vaginalis JCP8151B]
MIVDYIRLLLDISYSFCVLYTSFIGKSPEESQEKSQLYQTKKSRHAVCVKNSDNFL